MTDSTETVDGEARQYRAIPGDPRSIHQRMAAILKELPPIGKDDYNKEQRFHFRGHDSVLKALNPLLAKHEVFVVPNVLERVTSQRTTRSGGTMYEVNLHVGYRFYGPNGDCVEASAWGEGTDMGDKATNKAMTLAFKNVIAQSFAISTAESVDPDSETPEETVARGDRPEPSTPSGDFRTNPAEFLPPGFPPGKDLGDRIGKLLARVDPAVDWKATWDEAITLLVGVPRADLGSDGARQMWTRLANVADLLSRYVDAFPPVTDEDIQQAFAACFEGVTPTVVRHEPAEEVEAE